MPCRMPPRIAASGVNESLLTLVTRLGCEKRSRRRAYVLPLFHIYFFYF